MNYYADNDGDGQGAGTAINACAYPGNPYISSSGDCDDNNTVVNSQAIEVCDGWDNNCNGQINEGLQTNSITSINVNTAIFPTCTTGNLFSANLNNGVNTAIIEGTGPDLWYKLTAQYNTLRVGLSAASGSNSLSIYRDFGECLQMMMTENEITSGNQTLLTDDLVVGEVYYIALHQNSSPTNASAKLCLNHLVASTCDHVYSNYTGVYNSVCSSFKAQFKTYATNYIYNVQSASQNGIDLNITPWSYNTPTSSSIVTRLGSIFPVNMSGSAKNYVLSVPVVYGLSDAAGNLEFLTANGTSTCSLTLSSEAPVVLRSADRCPNVKAINQSIQTDRSICGAIRYEWEFTQLLPIAQTPIAVLGGLNSNVLFLNAVAGMSNGKTYNVRVRPIHSNGEVGAYGGSFCMKTTGAGMMIQSNENHQVAPSLLSSEIEVSLFPNPTADGKVSLLWNMYQEDFKHLILRDAQGRIVWKTDVMVEGNLLEIDISNIQSGWYSLEVNGKLLRVVKTE
jgi:hypothetical protein